MTKSQIAENHTLLSDRKIALCETSAGGVVVHGIDFGSKSRERVYNADKVWSGEHTILDYTEIQRPRVIQET